MIMRITSNPLRVIAVVIALLFVSESTTMLLMDNMSPIPKLAGALFDAALQSLILGLALILLVYKPFTKHIRDREAALRMLTKSEQRFQDIVENANEWMWEIDTEGRYIYASSVVERILGYTAEEVLGKHFYDLFHPDERETLKQEALQKISTKQPFHGFINRNVHKNGRSVWLATNGTPILSGSGRLLGYRGADAVKHDESSITDMLTGILNRQGFYLLAGQQIKLAIRNDLPIALLFADMDNLKPINDKLGHIEGDRALKNAATILKDSIRESDVVARYGGDEFVALLVGIGETDIKQRVLRNIDDYIAHVNASGVGAYTLSISIGYSIHDTKNICSIDDLIAQADKAMYARKRENRKRTRTYRSGPVMATVGAGAVRPQVERKIERRAEVRRFA